jgi:hypothetical protein
VSAGSSSRILSLETVIKDQNAVIGSLMDRLKALEVREAFDLCCELLIPSCPFSLFRNPPSATSPSSELHRMKSVMNQMREHVEIVTSSLSDKFASLESSLSARDAAIARIGDILC